MRNNVNKLICSAIYKALIYQITGAVNIELGKYIYDKGWVDWVNRNEPKNPKLNIYVIHW